MSLAEHDVTIESLLLRIFRKFQQLNTGQFVIHVVLSVVTFLEANNGHFLRNSSLCTYNKATVICVYRLRQ